MRAWIPASGRRHIDAPDLAGGGRLTRCPLPDKLSAVTTVDGLTSALPTGRVPRMRIQIERARPADAPVIAELLGELLHEIMAAIDEKVFEIGRAHV